MLSFTDFITEFNVKAYRSVNKNIGSAVSARDHEAAIAKKNALLNHDSQSNMARTTSKAAQHVRDVHTKSHLSVSADSQRDHAKGTQATLQHASHNFSVISQQERQKAQRERVHQAVQNNLNKLRQQQQKRAQALAKKNNQSSATV